MPSGARKMTATISARSKTGSEPYCCCKGAAMFSENPYMTSAIRISTTPNMLDELSRIDGNAMSTTPPNPIASPNT